MHLHLIYLYYAFYLQDDLDACPVEIDDALMIDEDEEDVSEDEDDDHEAVISFFFFCLLLQRFLFSRHDLELGGFS